MCYRVLLVDDDSSLLNSMSIYLSDYGFEIKSANTAIKALELIDYKIDLIVLDIVMPQLNGYDLIELMKKKKIFQDIPFIFLTAKGMTKDRIFGYNLGCNAYLVKPFYPEELVAIIKNIVSHRTQLFKSLNIKSNATDTIECSKNFTVKEKTVLKLVMQGLTNKEIANTLYFTRRNVEKYVSRLLAKTCTKNRTQLAQYGYQLGINLLKGE